MTAMSSPCVRAKIPRIRDASDGARDSSTDAGDENELAGVARKPPGAHVVRSNGYFTFVDNRNFENVKVQILPRWATLEHMGAALKSRTVVPAHFHDAREHPVRAFLVLRAWMLWKSGTNDFRNKRASRRRLFEKEAEALRADIVAMSCEDRPTTGDAYADELIRRWAPEVLAAA